MKIIFFFVFFVKRPWTCTYVEQCESVGVWRQESCVCSWGKKKLKFLVVALRAGWWRFKKGRNVLFLNKNPIWRFNSNSIEGGQAADSKYHSAHAFIAFVEYFFRCLYDICVYIYIFILRHTKFSLFFFHQLI